MKGVTEQFNFTNANSQELSGRLELPATKPVAFALFAHCFSCNKNVHAATRISRALRDQGIAVLRFDFTGLGASEGDFANTNFSSNLDDLRSAVTALRESHQAPSLLVGHSFGGTAMLFLASEIEEVRVVASIGAPSEPNEISKLLGAATVDRIETEGSAQVQLGAQAFQISRQFLTDISSASLQQRLKELKKPVVVFHAPHDEVVSIEHADKIVAAANHPKSFISLDGANHLLSRREDSEFVGDILAQWVARYLPRSSDASANDETSFPVVVTERSGSLTQDITAGHHSMIADEPIGVPGGNDLGMTPYDLLLAALGACTSMTLRMYANHKKLDLKGVTVELAHDRIHASDCETCEDQPRKVDHIRRYIKFDGDLTEPQRKRLLEIADKCPVHRTIMNQKQIVTSERT